MEDGTWPPTVSRWWSAHSISHRARYRASDRRIYARGALAACRDHGELRLEGKDYIVLDGDCINFRHAT